MRASIVLLLALLVLEGCSCLGCLEIPSLSVPVITVPSPTVQVQAPTPQVVVAPTVYPSIEFQAIYMYAFSVGGYWIWYRDFKEGEWTRWEITLPDEGDVMEMELAFLKRVPEGEWWRVQIIPKKEDSKPAIYEMLLSPETHTIRRVRRKIGTLPPEEVPVTENLYYIKPVKLTKESIEGATKGTETIKVPAGTFTARHVVYASLDGKGRVEWWATEKVPGGVVKAKVVDEEGKVSWISVLLSYGTGAKTLLGVY